MAVKNIEKPAGICSKANQLAKYISLNGNYNDMLNVMVLICRYANVFTTGQVPTVRKVRGGIQASSVSGLESALTAATSQSNAVHDFNNMRDNFFRNVAIKYPEIYGDNPDLLDRVCVEKIVTDAEIELKDCQGTIIGTSNTTEEFLDLWNNQKVPVDEAVCGVSTPYYFETHVDGFLGSTPIYPDNTAIPFNAPGVLNHRQLGEFEVNRRAIVDEEAQVKPKSIATYSDKEL